MSDSIPDSTAPTKEQIQISIDAEKAKISKDLTSLDSTTATLESLQDQAARNQQFVQNLSKINKDVATLQAVEASEKGIKSLYAQLLVVATTLYQLLDRTESVLFSGLQAVEAAAIGIQQELSVLKI